MREGQGDKELFIRDFTVSPLSLCITFTVLGEEEELIGLLFVSYFLFLTFTPHKLFRFGKPLPIITFFYFFF